jgi:hypothetical protein
MCANLDQLIHMTLDVGDVPNKDLRSNPVPGSNRQAVTKVVPLLDENGVPLLFDMYIDGIWHGSRRTLVQCESYFNFILHPAIGFSRRS